MPADTGTTGSSGSFQSSPPPKERCNPVRGKRRRERLATFNPHRPRRSGAIFPGATKKTVGLLFQSSPPPKERCNVATAAQMSPASCSFNPHRPRRSGAIRLDTVEAADTDVFQSSPPPKERCNTRHRLAQGYRRRPFNPHRPRRSGAMGVVVGGIALYKIWHFQSSPPPKERCNAWRGR